MLRALGELIARRPRTVIAVWVVLLAICGVLATGLSKQLKNSGFDVPGSPSQQAQTLTEAQFPQAGGSALIVAATAERPDAEALRRAIAAASRSLRGDEAATVQGAPQVSKDGRAALLPFTLSSSLADAQEEVPELAERVTASVPRGVDVQILGEAAAYKRYGEIAAEDLKRSETLSFPVPLLLLLVAFLSVTAALVPVASGLVCLACVFGVIYLVALMTDMSIFVANVASVLGIGLSIDFALFSVTRYRELRSGPDDLTPAEAAAMTVATTGRAIALSGLTIACSLALILVVGVGIFTSIAIGSILAALIAALVGITFVPAVLVLLGPRVERMWPRRGGRRRDPDRLWRRCAGWTTSHPVTSVLVACALLVVLALPVTGISIVSGPTSELPGSDPLRRSVEAVDDSFGVGTTAPVEVLARGRAGEGARRILAADPGIRGLLGVEAGQGGWRRIQAALADPPDSGAARSTVSGLQGELDHAGLDAYVGGQTAELSDLVARIEDRALYVVVGALLVGALLLGIGLRSIVVPIKAVLTTALSAAAGLGVVDFIFTDLGEQSGLGYFVPLVVFAIVFGLSIDYETFLMSRVREEVLGGRENRAAVVEGVARTGRSITLAGVVMLAVFGAFAAGHLAPFEELGLGLVVAVALDVTVVRLMLVPGTLVLLGRWNWWLPFRRAGAPRPARATRGARGLDP